MWCQRENVFQSEWPLCTTVIRLIRSEPHSPWSDAIENGYGPPVRERGWNAPVDSGARYWLPPFYHQRGPIVCVMKSVITEKLCLAWKSSLSTILIDPLPQVAPFWIRIETKPCRAILPHHPFWRLERLVKRGELQAKRHDYQAPATALGLLQGPGCTSPARKIPLPIDHRQNAHDLGHYGTPRSGITFPWIQESRRPSEVLLRGDWHWVYTVRPQQTLTALRQFQDYRRLINWLTHTMP